MRTRIGAFLVLMGLTAVLAVSAADRGAIEGSVIDGGGRRLAGVVVDLTGPMTRKTLTNERGEFAFAALIPGRYQLRFTISGFAPLIQASVVRAGRTERLNIRLAPTPDPKQRTDNVPRPLVVAETPFGARAGLEGAYAPAAPYPIDRYVGPFNTEAYDHTDENPFRRVANDPLSTFSIDVDTASYANVRRFLNSGALPPAGAVRIEELINYFRFDYPQPTTEQPFSVTTELADCPWNPKHRLALIGLQGRLMREESPPARNLVFLIDVSGSMMSPDKLPLVRIALRMLTDVLNSRDRVAIVVYAGSSGLVLPSTSGDRKATIHNQSRSSRLAARPTAAPAYSSPIASLARISSAAPSIALFSPQTATSMLASRIRMNWCG